jgi:hypothetical protein
MLYQLNYEVKTANVYQFGIVLVILYTRNEKYMHAETPRLAGKTIIFSEHEVFEVVAVVTR